MLKAIEGLREKGIIKHSLEAKVIAYFDPKVQGLDVIQDFFEDLEASGQSIESFFKEFVIVSQFVIAQSPEGLEKSEYPGLFVKVEKATGEKCPRCWQWEIIDNKDNLCDRCQMIVTSF